MRPLLRHLKWLVLIAILVALGVALNRPRQRRVPRSTKIADCTNTVLSIKLTAPKGHMLTFVLAMPSPGPWFTNHQQPVPFVFSGKARITQQGRHVYDFAFDSRGAVRCNWLSWDQDLPLGFIITEELFSQHHGLGEYLKPRKAYDVQIEFLEQPPASASIWYTWSQLKDDFDRDSTQ